MDKKFPSVGAQNYTSVRTMKSGLAYDEKGLPFIVLVLNELIYVMSEGCVDDTISQLTEHRDMLKKMKEASKLIG